MKRIVVLLSPLLIAAGLFAFHPAALGQGNPTCPTRPSTDSSNACASTQFVKNTISQGPGQLDVWILIGSSNTVGQGLSTQAPIPPSTALMYCNLSASNPGVQALADPVCSAVSISPNWNANSGSEWPAFAIAYNRPVAIIQTAVSGSTQSSACDLHVGNGNWQDTTPGSNYANALAAVNAALTTYQAAGYATTLRGIIQTDLGTNDALGIDGATCTTAQYTAAFNAMAANWRSATIGGKVYPNLPIFMSLVGTNTNPSFPDNPGYYAIRNAQLSITSIDLNTLMPFVELPSFANRNWIQPNSVHPYQIGYNEWGTRLGGSVFPYVAGNISYQVYNANIASQPLPPTGTVLQVVGGDAVNPIILMDAFGSPGIPGTIILRSARSTNTSPTAIQTNDGLGSFGVRGWGTTGYGARNSGSILFSAEQNWTDTAQGTRACVFTTPNGSTVPSCNLTVNQAGIVSAQIMSAAFMTVGNGTTDAPLSINQNTSGVPQAPGTGVGLHMIGANGNNNNFTYDSFYNNTAFGVNLFIGRSANGTASAPLALSANTFEFGINAQGWDGVSNYATSATLDFLSINQQSPTDSSGQIRLRTTATGTVANPIQRLLVKQGIMVGNISTDPGPGVAILSSQAFSSLASCTSSLRGSIAAVSDSNTVTWGATVAGGSTHEIIAHCNGSNWTVMGD